MIKESNGIQKLIAEAFLENIAHLKTLSLMKMAKKSFVSTASIIRFCQSLGYKGYSEFKYLLVNEYEKNIANQ